MKNNLNNLTLKEKLGQMIVLGLDVPIIDDKILKLLKENSIGGVVLYKKNYHDTASMIKLINKLKKNNPNNIPMIFAIDQENGLVNRFPNDIKRLPSPRHQVKNNIVNECNELTISILTQLGINMNLAPVIDVDRHHESNVNGTRSYSTNYQEVIKYSDMTIEAYQQSGIIPVGKHFPGHGLVKGDSHFTVPVIDDLKTLEQEELKIFNTLAPKLDVLMTSHLRIKGYGFKPTTMNKDILEKYLPKDINLLITDDIRMNYLHYLYGTKKVFLDCLSAGNNLIMIKYYPGIHKLFPKLLKKISTNQYLINQVNNSVNKIILLKEKYHLSNEPITNNLNIEKINDKITKLSC